MVDQVTGLAQTCLGMLRKEAVWSGQIFPHDPTLVNDLVLIIVEGIQVGMGLGLCLRVSNRRSRVI